MAIVRKYKGGAAEQVSTIPKEWVPYITKGLASADANLEAGNLSKVVGQNEYQKAAQDAAVGVANLQGNVGLHSSEALNQLGRVASGQEIVPASTGATDAIKQAAIYQAGVSAQPGIASAAARGTVGGSRNLVSAGAGANDLAAKLAGIDYTDLQARRQAAQGAAGTSVQLGGDVQNQLITGANTLKGVGADIQKQGQAEADTAFQGLSRYASLIQGTPWQSQQQVQGGK